MEINPYDPPTRDASIAQALADDGPRARPIGVWVIAGLYILSALVLVLLAVWLLYLNSRGDVTSSAIIPFQFILVFGLFTAVLFLFTGVGVWVGAQWSWWVASFFQVMGVVGSMSVVAIAVAKSISTDLGQVLPVLSNHGIRLTIHGLLLWYLFRSKVMCFFALEGLNRIKAFAVLVPISIVAFGTMLGALIYRAMRF